MLPGAARNSGTPLRTSLTVVQRAGGVDGRRYASRNGPGHSELTGYCEVAQVESGQHDVP
jgi:hypothetical protein